jgi:hypothetical protein
MENPEQAKAETDSTATAGGDQANAETTNTEVTATETAPGKESTTTTEKPTGATEAPARTAVGVEGYEKMLADAKAEAEQKTSQAKAEKWDAARAEAQADSDASKTTAEVPPEESAATTDVATEAAVPPGKAEETEEQKSDKRIRLKGLKDGHLVEAANTIAREEGIPFGEAWDRVSPKRDVPATNGTTETTEAPQVRTREEIESDIAALDAEYEKAGNDLDTGAMVQLRKRERALDKELNQVEASEKEAARQLQEVEQERYNSTANGSKAKAVEYWPEARDEKSELSKLTVELADAYEKDPDLQHRVSEPDSPFFFTELAARQLGLLPKHLRKDPPDTNGTKPSTSTAATKPAPVNQRAVGRPAQPAAAPASGAARTTQEGSKADALGLDKIHSVTDYEKVLEKAKRLVPA